MGRVKPPGQRRSKFLLGIIVPLRHLAQVTKPRIALSLTPDGILEIFVNKECRDLMVRELQHLSVKSDHFHFGPTEADEVQVRTNP